MAELTAASRAALIESLAPQSLIEDWIAGAVADCLARCQVTADYQSGLVSALANADTPSKMTEVQKTLKTEQRRIQYLEYGASETAVRWLRLLREEQQFRERLASHKAEREAEQSVTRRCTKESRTAHAASNAR